MASIRALPTRMFVYGIMLSCLLLPAIAGKTEDMKSAIDSFVQEGLACHRNCAGFTISVVSQGDVVISKGYGYKTVEKKEPVTNETLFGIASLTKAFTATLMLKLIEEHENLTITTKVKDILNNDHVFYDSLRSQYTTLEDLMAHRLGIPENNYIRLDETLTRENLVGRLQYLKPIGGFRTSFYYNNLMYGLLTHIAEVIGQKRWEDLIQEKLLDPLSMMSTTFATTADRPKLDISQGYEYADEQLYPISFDINRHWATLCGSGCVLTNSNDMIQWMNFHLTEGKNKDGDSIVDSDILKNAYKNQNSVHSPFYEEYYTRPITPVTRSQNNYGFAWKLGYYRGSLNSGLCGYKIITHSGATYGYRSLLTLVPALQIGVFTAVTGCNIHKEFRSNVHSYAIDVISGDQPWLNSTSVCTFPEPWKKRKEEPTETFETDIKASRDLKFYTGTFYNKAYGTCQVYLNDSLEFLMAKIGVGHFILQPQSQKDEFYAEGDGLFRKLKEFSKFHFQFTDEEEYAVALVVQSFNYDDPPVFDRNEKQVSRVAINRGTPEIITLSLSSVLLFQLFPRVLY